MFGCTEVAAWTASCAPRERAAAAAAAASVASGIVAGWTACYGLVAVGRRDRGALIRFRGVATALLLAHAWVLAYFAVAGRDLTGRPPAVLRGDRPVADWFDVATTWVAAAWMLMMAASLHCAAGWLAQQLGGEAAPPRGVVRVQVVG